MKKLTILFVFIALFCSCGKKPEADFSWTPTNPKAGQQMHFNNLSVNARSYSWNFGDMSIGSETNPVHVYARTGNYIIDLTALNGLRSDIKTVTIYVAP